MEKERTEIQNVIFIYFFWVVTLPPKDFMKFSLRVLDIRYLTGFL